MSEIHAGDFVWAKDANGDLLPRRAITDCLRGHDFPVIWVTREEQYEESLKHSYPPERGDFGAPGIPWPEEDVTLREAEEGDPRT